MAAHPRAYHLLLYCLLCFSMAPHAAALSFSYNFSANPSDLNDTNLRYLGDSVPAGDRINLTTLGTWSKGRVAYLHPVLLWDDGHRKRASFTTMFSFAISDENKNDRGDGMAFFIGPCSPAIPPDSNGGPCSPAIPPDSNGSYLGLFNNPSNHPPPPQTVGVEFDTCNSADVDPQNVTVTDHIGIDVNSINSTNYTALRNLALSGTMSATVKYEASSKVMSVDLSLADGTHYSVSTRVDLKDAGVPQYATVGFSAATGHFVESHQLLSWSFRSEMYSKTIELWVIILIAVVGASVAAGFVAALVYYSILMDRPAPLKITVPVVKEFTYRQLSEATNNFSKDRELGKGAFGIVYSGDLQLVPSSSPVPVAVKKMLTGQHNEQIQNDYVTEIMTLCQINHRNLVRLLGWCGDGDKLLLVYELVANKSLDKHLHGSERLLTWAERYKIALGIGSAIENLHTGYSTPVLHRDIKPSNVMLDEAFEAKLGDFGLVRQAPEGYLQSTMIAGCLNYIEPACISQNTDGVQQSKSSDMYSFGVLLLEVATGTRPQKVSGNDLVTAVRESYARGEVLEMADTRLNDDFDRNQMERVLLVGLLCVQRGRPDRPGIRDAVNLLSDLSSHPVPPVLN